MINLIKAELYRFFKSKQFIISAVLAVTFAVIVVLLNYFLSIAITKVMGEAVIDRKTFSSLAIMINALNPGALFGYILAVFVAVLLAMEFTDGTIRTKIICGISKIKIYSANYLASLIYIITIMLGYGILSLLFGLILYSPIPQDVDALKYVGNYFMTLSFDLISYIFVSSTILLLVMLIRTQGLSSFLYIIAVIGFQFVGGILDQIIEIINAYETNMESVITFINVINWINPFYLMTTLSTNYYSTGLIVANSITPLAWGALNFYLGYLAFVKRDIK